MWIGRPIDLCSILYLNCSLLFLMVLNLNCTKLLPISYVNISNNKKKRKCFHTWSNKTKTLWIRNQEILHSRPCAVRFRWLSHTMWIFRKRTSQIAVFKQMRFLCKCLLEIYTFVFLNQKANVWSSKFTFGPHYKGLYNVCWYLP